MASLPYFVLSPSGIVCLVGLLHGPDKTIPTPVEDYRKATVDLVIPAYNEEKSVVLCLESIAKQTIRPTQVMMVLIVDDGSTDKTSMYAQKFAESIGLKLTLMRREKSEGKTPTLHKAAKESKADVLFVLDADTTLRSENYIEKLLEELYKGVGIACASGVILPEFERDRDRLLLTPAVTKFAETFPEVKQRRDPLWIQRLLHAITNNYREELYLFLQKFIYHGEMVFFGSIINPIGCAVAYRRQYLNDVLDYYEPKLGFDLTASEDIFIGFAFAELGYRNIQVQDVYALTVEPRLTRLPKQIMMWSSSFLQSCYYFNSLVCAPFKSPWVFYRYIKNRLNPEYQSMLNKRKIQEAYRQSFGSALTQKYSRPIGWFIFTSLFEKISYPTVIIILLILHMWIALAFTLLAEVTLYTILIALMHKNRRLKNVLKSICYTPLRYLVLMYDVVIILNFAKDIWITKNRKWRK